MDKVIDITRFQRAAAVAMQHNAMILFKAYIGLHHYNNIVEPLYGRVTRHLKLSFIS